MKTPGYGGEKYGPTVHMKSYTSLNALTGLQQYFCTIRSPIHSSINALQKATHIICILINTHVPVFTLCVHSPSGSKAVEKQTLEFLFSNSDRDTQCLYRDCKRSGHSRFNFTAVSVDCFGNTRARSNKLAFPDFIQIFTGYMQHGSCDSMTGNVQSRRGCHWL